METQALSRRYGQVYFLERGLLGIISPTVNLQTGEPSAEKWLCHQWPPGVCQFDWVEFFVQDQAVAITRRYASNGVHSLERACAGVVISSTATEALIRVGHNESMSVPTGSHSSAATFSTGDLVCFGYPKYLDENVKLLDRSHSPLDGQCPICLDLHHLYSLCGCAHMACRDCLAQYLVDIHADGTKYPLQCFGPGCHCGVPLNEACSFLIPDQFRKMEKFYCYFALPERNRSKCPSCDHVMFYGNADPMGQCHVCVLAYCGRCSISWDVHGGRTCEQVRRDDTELRELAARQGWKQCPGCKIMIERVKGCNHMQHNGCSGSRSEDGATHFCYQCGVRLINARQTEDLVNHFPSGLFRPCVLSMNET